MELIGTKICMTKDVGTHGNMFGGEMMSFIDECGAAYACICCNTSRMVTLKISELIFKKPVKVGEIVRIYSEVKKMGTSSITLKLLVKNHNPQNGVEEVTTSTEIVFVKIDEDGKTAKI